MPMFAVGVGIVPSTEVTAVDVEHTLTCKTRSICPQGVDAIAVPKAACAEDDRLDTDVHSLGSGVDLLDRR